jgi:hypothetical protein
MKYFLTLLLLLVPRVAVPEIRLEAPEVCVVGELVVLDASESVSETLVWQISPFTPDFKVFDKQACFSSRVIGEYMVIIAGVEEGQPVLRTHMLRVGVVSPVDLSTQMEEWAKEVTSENVMEEALKFAQSFRALADADIPPEQFITATADANRRALGESLDAWKPFLDRLGAYLNTLAVDGRLLSPDDYRKTWITVADSIEECFK